MAEKTNDSPNPLAPSNVHSDHESVAANTKELKQKKRMKCLLYTVLFAVFQTGIILVFVLTFMRTRNLKFGIRSGSFVASASNVGTEASPSFDLQLDTHFTVKNANFGQFTYEAGTVTFSYRGTPVGEARVEKGRTGARSTKKVDAVVVLRSSRLSSNTSNNEMGRSDISSGSLPLTGYSKLEGKVHLMKVIKKKKSAQMNCTMEIHIPSRTLSKIVCK